MLTNHDFTLRCDGFFVLMGPRIGDAQTVTCGTNNAGAASFVLSFREAKTESIPGNADATAVKAKLDALKTYACLDLYPMIYIHVFLVACILVCVFKYCL